MLLPSETAAAGEAIAYPTVGPAAISSAEAAVMHPTNALLVDLFQSLAALCLQVGDLQAQVVTQQAQIVNLTTSDTDKDPVCQVNELTQKDLLANYTESHSYTGLPHDRVHTCSWAIDGTSGEVISASSETIKQARKDCARLYLEAFEHTE